MSMSHSDYQIGDQHHYRRMPFGALRQTLGIALSAERAWAAIAIQNYGHMPCGSTISVNPLSSERSTLSIPTSDRAGYLTERMTEYAAEMSDLVATWGTDAATDLFGDVEHGIDTRSLMNVDMRRNPDARRSAGRKSPKIRTLPTKVIPDRRAPAPLLPPMLIESDQDSYEIDLIVHGLLRYYRVDVPSLIDELRSLPKGVGDLASPSSRSNHAYQIKALGYDFPPALFRLRGDYLELRRLVLDARDADGGEVLWQWTPATRTSGPILQTASMMPRLDLYRSERRSLAEVIGDGRIHPSLRIAKAWRDLLPTSSLGGSTVIEMHQRSVPLLSRGEPLPERTAPARTSIPLPVWMEPEEHSPQQCEQRLTAMVKSLLQPYPFRATAYDDHVELTLSTKYSEAQRYPTNTHLAGYRYRFVQDDFRDDATLRSSLARTIEEHAETERMKQRYARKAREERAAARKARLEEEAARRKETQIREAAERAAELERKREEEAAREKARLEPTPARVEQALLLEAMGGIDPGPFGIERPLPFAIRSKIALLLSEHIEKYAKPSTDSEIKRAVWFIDRAVTRERPERGWRNRTFVECALVRDVTPIRCPFAETLVVKGDKTCSRGSSIVKRHKVAALRSYDDWNLIYELVSVEPTGNASQYEIIGRITLRKIFYPGDGQFPELARSEFEGMVAGYRMGDEIRLIDHVYEKGRLTMTVAATSIEAEDCGEVVDARMRWNRLRSGNSKTRT